MRKNLQAPKEKHRTGAGGFENRMANLDPRLDRSNRDGRNIREHQGMANIGRDPRLNLADPRLANQDLKIRDERNQHQRNLIDPRFDPRRQRRK